MKLSLFLLGLVCFTASPLWSRIWKSADGAKTFEGKLKAYDAETGRVTVIVNGLPLMVRQDKLSEADISFLKEWSKESGAPEKNSAQASAVGEKVAKAKLQILDGKRYRNAELTKSPDYFIFYYSASWCGPCRASAPQFVEQYKSKIAGNPKVELIHISQDQSEENAEEWAAKEGFPWLTVVPKDVERSKLLEFKTARSVPHYVMVDRDGNVLANSSAEIFQKIDELASGNP
jgi:thiol-disulfide isomerase/thioredoxin